MSLYCHICGKIVPAWTGQYRNLANKLSVKTPFGTAHKVCWDFAQKRQRALAEGRDNPWMAEDIRKLASSQKGRVQRAEKKIKEKVDSAYKTNLSASQKKRLKNPLTGTLSGMEVE